MTYETLWHRLLSVYDEGEAKAVVRYALDVRFGLSLSDILCGKVTQLSSDDQAELEKIMLRLANAEPVQYVLGVADFCGRQYHVRPGVLIPRPETADLCREIIADVTLRDAYAFLDIGTGSGCIAITLSLDIPQSEVTAWDISEEALQISRENAKTLNASVRFEHQDILQKHADTERWDIIVSNPPYICDKERTSMERNVLCFEPHQALFVPDEEPLLFYKAIADYAIKALRKGGVLYFELNPIHALETEKFVHSIGFSEVSLRKDQFDKLRFLKAIKI